jgi:NAD+ synthase
MQKQKIIAYIVNWLTAYCRQAGTDGYVVGISGGIDSAVTSTLCAKTGLSVLVLNMPIYQARAQINSSSKHIAWLQKKFSNVQGLDVDLTQSFQALEETFDPAIQDDLTMANTRSRLRMLTLYAYATHHGLLVAGTGNKVEDFGVGFFTKYGDGGVDVGPIADLMKTEVYELGKELEITPEILEAVPTDGLFADNRSDEEQLGASYAELEWAMHFEQQEQKQKELTSRQKEVLNLYRRMHQKNLHKMQPIPVATIPPEYR